MFVLSWCHPPDSDVSIGVMVLLNCAHWHWISCWPALCDVLTSPLLPKTTEDNWVHLGFDVWPGTPDVVPLVVSWATEINICLCLPTFFCEVHSFSVRLVASTTCVINTHKHVQLKIIYKKLSFVFTLTSFLLLTSFVTTSDLQTNFLTKLFPACVLTHLNVWN